NPASNTSLRSGRTGVALRHRGAHNSGQILPVILTLMLAKRLPPNTVRPEHSAGSDPALNPASNPSLRSGRTGVALRRRGAHNSGQILTLILTLMLAKRRPPITVRPERSEGSDPALNPASNTSLRSGRTGVALRHRGAHNSGQILPVILTLMLAIRLPPITVRPEHGEGSDPALNPASNPSLRSGRTGVALRRPSQRQRVLR
ncbi:MAG: hypothetical protein H7203_08050, partial [Rhizobacter sp.]|nr:hypothetical protein [Burkholderiales bacterium]